jgi:anti-sigma B factor antagonist
MSHSDTRPAEADVTAADAVVVHLRGDVDAATAGAFRRRLDEAVAAGRPYVLVDVSGVGFFDSAGLAVLVRVRRELPPGQQLALANVPRRMQRVLRVAALDSLMRVHGCGEPWPWPALEGLVPVPCSGP